MKLPVSNTNAPVWRDITIHSQLPDALKTLDELSHNLWWVWNSEAKNLFRDLDHDLWRSTGENPVMLLQQLSSERLDEIMGDKDMMDRIAQLLKFSGRVWVSADCVWVSVPVPPSLSSPVPSSLSESVLPAEGSSAQLRSWPSMAI